MLRIPVWPAFVLLLTVLLVLCPGCAVLLAAGGVGAGVTWHQNAMRSTIDAQPRQVMVATEQVFQDMSIAVSSGPRLEPDQARITGQTPDDTRVRVRAQAEDEHTSRLIVRVGLADRQRSLDLHNRIVHELGLLPAEQHQPPPAVR